MSAAFTRRIFLKRSSLMTAGLAAWGAPCAALAAGGETVSVGIIGCNGRGMDHLAAYLSIPKVEITYICDVDSRARDKGVAAVLKRQPRRPQSVTDLRRILDDPGVDAVSIATPDHWHAPAAILACAAGKHVYVEKPGSHNAREGEWLVAAARKHRRVVQMGNQRRSWPWVQQAMDALHTGELGNVYFARSWYTNHRGSIGHGKLVPVPPWLDFSLWQGPAPERPFRDNIVHYNWHWFWNWGTGELGNNGIHALDLARWGLGLDLACPQFVTCGGNRYHYQDDWETPDTYIASFDFGGKGIAWEGRSCDPRGFEGTGFGVNFYGERGTLVVAGESARIYDLSDKLVREIRSKYDDVSHFANFIDGIRLGTPLRAEIGIGQQSTLLCHLGNIACRTGHTLNVDPVRRKIIGDHAASALWGRAYRKGWEPKV